MVAETHRQRERDKEFIRRAQPQPVADFCPILAEYNGKKPGCDCEQRRLPQIIRQFTYHFALPDLPAFCCTASPLTVFSSLRTSSSVIFPASASCAITGWACPPKKLEFRRAGESREISDLKIAFSSRPFSLRIWIARIRRQRVIGQPIVRKAADQHQCAGPTRAREEMFSHVYEMANHGPG